MNSNYNIKEISDSSKELQVRINNFKLKQLQKDDLLIIEKNKLDIVLDLSLIHISEPTRPY